VGDKKNGGASRLAKVLQKLQDLGLDGHIQRGGGFVGNDKLRVAGDSHGDHHTLAHSAAHLVRVIHDPHFGGRDSHLSKKFDGPLHGFRLPNFSVAHNDFTDLISHPENRVEGRHGLLEDHGNPVASDGIHFFLGKREQVHSLEEDPSIDDFAGW
jgi:hypothetical protein